MKESALNWNKIVPYLGNARESIARLDEELKGWGIFIDLFHWDEAIASLQSPTKPGLRALFTRLAENKNEPRVRTLLFLKQALDEAFSWNSFGKRFFCRIQAIIKQDSVRKEDIGRFRNRQNWIGPKGCKIDEAYFYPPPASRVGRLFCNLEAYLASKEPDPLVQTAIAFAQFLIIHPFMDGNGRTARTFIPFFAMKKGLLSQPALLLSAYFERERTDYFQKLCQLTESEDWEDWIVFFLKGVILQAERTKRRAGRLKKVFKTIEEFAGPLWAKKLFRTPVIQFSKGNAADLLVQKKILVAKKGLYFAEPIFRAMRKN